MLAENDLSSKVSCRPIIKFHVMHNQVGVGGGGETAQGFWADWIGTLRQHKAPIDYYFSLTLNLVTIGSF